MRIQRNGLKAEPDSRRSVLSNTMKENDDWRLQGQERYLMGSTLIHREYRQNPRNSDWDHDHCAFCGKPFSLEDIPDALKEGYATEDDYRWICSICFLDFKDDFKWPVIENDN